MENFINVKDFGAVGDGVTDDTLAIQNAINTLGTKSALYFPHGTYRVSKNNSLEGFPANDQPCLLVRGMSDVKIFGGNAILSVWEHAQGILEIQDSNHIVVEGLSLFGGGNFVPMDGTTGRGEKGTTTDGYYTSGFWGYYKNNSNNTSANTSGGTGISKPWGVHNGGFIGNISYGILIHNGCRNITIRNVESSGFNYAGIGVGHNGDNFPQKLNYPDSTNIRIQDCWLYDNYNSGISLQAVDGVTVENCEIERIGQPEALERNDLTYYDSGYGITCVGSIFSIAKHVTIAKNRIRDCARKGVDFHAGHKVSVSQNMIKNCKVGGVFGNWVDTNIQNITEIIINGNIIEECGYKESSAILVKGANSTTKACLNINVIISDNILLNCSGNSGIIQSDIFDRLTIANNQIIGASINSPALRYGISLGKSGYISYMLVCVGNIIDANGNTNLMKGIQAVGIAEGVISNNIIKIDHNASTSNIGIEALKNMGNVSAVGNVAVMSSQGRPFYFNTTGQRTANSGTGGHLASVL